MFAALRTPQAPKKAAMILTSCMYRMQDVMRCPPCLPAASCVHHPFASFARHCRWHCVRHTTREVVLSPCPWGTLRMPKHMPDRKMMNIWSCCQVRTGLSSAWPPMLRLKVRPCLQTLTLTLAGPAAALPPLQLHLILAGLVQHLLAAVLARP